MKTLSKMAQDEESHEPLTHEEREGELETARAVVREALALGKLPASYAPGITIEVSHRLTSTMGKAITDNYDSGLPPRGKIRISASALWRRASPEKRRNTVIHELAHILANWKAGKRSGHGWAWKAEMRAMGESPVRCHSVPPVRKPKKVESSPRRPRRRARKAIVPNNLAPFYVPNPAYKLKAGDTVLFGRPNGEKTKGRVLRVNAKSISIETTEGRSKYPVDTRFRVSRKFCKKVAP